MPDPDLNKEDPTAKGFVVMWVSYGVVFGLSALFLRVPALSGWAGTAIPLLFLLAALEGAERSGLGLQRAALRFGGLLDRSKSLTTVALPALGASVRETGFALGAAAVVFPPYVLAFWFYHRPEGPFSFEPSLEWFGFFLTHLLAVALPEEAFFRGFVQSSLRARYRSSFRLFGARISPAAWLLQAALFALIHLAGNNHPGVLLVFFPGLIFGWLRAYRGGIGASVVFHALSNLLGKVLFQGWQA